MRAPIVAYVAVAVCLTVVVVVGLWISGSPRIRWAVSEAVRGVSWVLKRALALLILAFSASEQRQAETKEGFELWKAGFRFGGAMKIAASHGLHWLLAGAILALLAGWMRGR